MLKFRLYIVGIRFCSVVMDMNLIILVGGYELRVVIKLLSGYVE